MGRTFEALRRRDAAHESVRESPDPVSRPAPVSVDAARADSGFEFDLGPGEIPFIEVGPVEDQVAVAAAPAPVSPPKAPPTVTTPAVESSQVRFQIHDAESAVRHAADAGIVVVSQPHGAEAAQYRQVRDALLEQLARFRIKTVALTPLDGLGGCLAAINLACAMMENTARTVLLIDADVNGASVAARLGLASAPGWAELLVGLPMAQVLQQSLCAGLHVIAAGNRLVGARSLTRMSALQEHLAALAKCYDLILLRSPAVQPAVEAQALAHACGAVCFLQTGPHNKNSEPQELVATWQRDGIRVLGTIVTAAESSAAPKW
jgi:Mrp family chromosome partitioning ATPase